MKRGDDAERKAEGKAWVESKKAKHQLAKKGEDHGVEREKGVQQGQQGQQQVHDGEKGSSRQEGLMGRVTDELERVVEEAGRGEEEAVGVQPSAHEGSEQGPIGGRV